MRHANRANHEMRKVELERNYTKHAEGSVLVTFGDTRVLCNASVTSGVPPFLKDKGMGWVTAEYGMLPRSTHERMLREAAKGKQAGRTQEIQRLIARSLRAAVDLTKLVDYTITIDCDVLQADGGTRTAAITGGCVALYDAIRWLQQKKPTMSDAFVQWVASVSVGVYQQEVLLDLDYQEDSQAETDMNVVMTGGGRFIEVQGTAERQTFTEEELTAMLKQAKAGIANLIVCQKKVVG